MKTTAQRQAAYRQRHLKGIDGTKARLSTVIDYSAKCSLERMATHLGITQAECLMRLIREEEDRLLSGMTGKEQDAYYDLSLIHI